MTTGNLTELLLAERGDGPALLTTEGKATSYQALRKKVRAMSDALCEGSFTKGDRIAFRGKKSENALAFYLACLHNGLIYIPLNTAYAKEEVRYFIEDARPAAIFVDHIDPSVSDFVSGLPVDRVQALDRGFFNPNASSEKLQPVVSNTGDLAALLYTSGTTGRPKGAMITHSGLIANAKALVKAWEFQSRDVVLHALPMFHGHGLFLACHVPLMAGGAILFVPRFDADEVIEHFTKATVFMGVPTLYTRLLAAAKLAPEACESIRLFISGSAPLSADVFAQFRERTGAEIVERFGTTETSICATNPVRGERRPGTVGKVLSGVKMRIVDANGSEVEPGTVGRVAVRGANVFAGYWNRMDRSGESFTGGYFLTGDLARVSQDGYVTIVGREKDMIISGGFNVYAAEVEAIIDRVPGVADCAVIGAPHPDLGEAVVAVVVKAHGELVEESAVIEAVGRNLAKYKVPKSLVFIDNIPRNAMGKVMKADLRNRFSSLFVSVAK